MNVIQQISITGTNQCLYLRGIDPVNQTLTYNDDSNEPAKTESFSISSGGLVVGKYTIPLAIITDWMKKNGAVDEKGNVIEIPAIYGK